jgi:hypothetical protein
MMAVEINWGHESDYADSKAIDEFPQHDALVKALHAGLDQFAINWWEKRDGEDDIPDAS